MERTAGLLCPLFSLRSRTSAGIGEIPDLERIAPWLAEARLRVLMLLPLLEAGLGQESPYGPLTAFAIDPIYIGLDRLERFDTGLDAADREALERARASASVEYGTVRPIKMRILRHAFARFDAGADAETARDFASFRAEHAGWLDDYALFRAIKGQEPRGWAEWSDGLRARDPAALAAAREAHAEDVEFFAWAQWVAWRQLVGARTAMREHGIALAGDLPFLVGSDSADVWARQAEFDLDGSVGAPPDAFSAEGQDWGLPGYRWDAITAGGYSWFHARGRRAAELYDWVRVDHVVGLYRTWIKPRGGTARFVPSDEPDQLRQGEAVLDALRATGAALVAEDLGVIPPFVRDSLTRLEIPGYRVLRWEMDQGVFRDPSTWPARSVATSGTHDTEPMSVWWDELPEHERRAARQLPRLRGLPDDEVLRFGPRVHAALLESLYGAGSSLLILPIQDLFGARDRINLPGTVSDTNWRYRTPFAIEDLREDPALAARTAELARLAREHGR